MKILVADPIAEEGLKILREQANVDVKAKLKPEELKAIVGDYDALIVRSQTQVPAEIVEAGRKLKVIGRAGVGIDNIDVGAATRQGIVVVNAPTGNTVSAAEHAMALMLALARNIPQANSQLKSGVWQRGKLIGVELRNKTLGIIGLGNVGSEVAKRAQAFEMRVIAYDPFVSLDYAQTHRVDLVSLDGLFEQADVITLHVPLTSATRSLIGARELAKIKPTALIINCARGGLVDEDALAEAVKARRIAGAALDVFSAEPVTASPLFESDKIVTTPHLGASTFEAQINVSRDIAEQVLTVLKGQFSKYAVNAPYVSSELMPSIRAASTVGSFASQLMEGQISEIHIKYAGELANHDCSPFKAAIVSALLQETSEETVNLVNVNFVAKQRGLKISEETELDSQNYSNLLTLRIDTDKGPTTVSSTVRDNEVHVVQVNDFWMDIVPTGGHFLLCTHLDQPGMVGTIGNITGRANINISSMYVSRLQPRGQAVMLLALDEPIGEQQIQEILAIPGIHTARALKL